MQIWNGSGKYFGRYRTDTILSTDGRTDAQTDGRRETSIPPFQLHWSKGYKNAIILTKFSSLATPEVVILTSSSAASDENLIKMTFLFQGVPVMKEFPCHDLLMWCMLPCFSRINTLRLRQNGRHFADDIFKCIFLNENVWITVKISLKFVPKAAINNIPALVQIMAWRRSGDKPLSEPMMVGLPTHICVTRP